MNLLNEIIWLKNKHKLRKIKFLFLDIDGVLTDGGLWYDANGNVIKCFDVQDGLGIKLLQENGVEVIFISGGQGGSSEIRAKILGIKICLVGVKNKSNALKNLQTKFKINKEDSAYVGDDLNDISVKPLVSLLLAPKSANKIFKNHTHLTLSKEGGKGAIRELSDRILEAKGYLQKYNCKGWVESNY